MSAEKPRSPYVPRARSAAFACATVFQFPHLLPVLQAHLDEEEGAILPILLISDVTRFVVTQLNAPWVDDLIQHFEVHFSLEDDADLFSDIVQGFVEGLPYTRSIYDQLDRCGAAKLKAELTRFHERTHGSVPTS